MKALYLVRVVRKPGEDPVTATLAGLAAIQGTFPVGNEVLLTRGDGVEGDVEEDVPLIPDALPRVLIACA